MPTATSRSGAGDRLPGIPANLFKLGVDYKVTDQWTVGGTGDRR